MKPTSIVLLALAALGLVGAAAGSGRARRTLARRSPKGRLIGPPDARVHYVQDGQGPDVVLIHGAAMRLDEMLAGPFGLLAQNYRVTAFDRPGHGFSDPLTRDPSPKAQARRLHAAVVELGIERPTLVGHSLGGAVALAYGEAWPQETGGVVAVAPLAYPGWGLGHLAPALHAAPGVGLLLSYSLFAALDPLLMRGAYRQIFAPQKPTPEFRAEFPFDLATLPAEMRRHSQDLIAASRALQALSQRYGAYPAPVHVVVGDADRILKPARQAERLADALGERARLTQVRGYGHMVHHVAPEAVEEAIVEVRARALGAPTLRSRATALAAREPPPEV